MGHQYGGPEVVVRMRVEGGREKKNGEGDRQREIEEGRKGGWGHRPTYFFASPTNIYIVHILLSFKLLQFFRENTEKWIREGGG